MSQIQELSDDFGIKVLAVRREGSDNPIYWLTVEGHDGEIKLGRLSELMTATKTRYRLAESCRVVIPRFKPEDWDAVLRCIVSCSEP